MNTKDSAEMHPEEFRVSRPSTGVKEFWLTSSEELLAIVIAPDRAPEGIQFLTSPTDQFQIGQLGWKSGHEIEAHSHTKVSRTVNRTSEVLFIRRGKVEVNLYTEDGVFLTCTILESGDVVALFAGGHGFTILEDADIIEVKQGPYIGEEEKFRFLANGKR